MKLTRVLLGILPSLVVGTEFHITFPSDVATTARKAAKLHSTDEATLTGRVRLYITRDNSTAPYESSSDDQGTGQVNR